MNMVSPRELAGTIPTTPWINLSEELALYSMVGLVGPEVCSSFSDQFEAGRRLPMGQRPWELEADCEDEQDTTERLYYRPSPIWTRIILWSATIRRLMAENNADNICILGPIRFTCVNGRLRMSFSFYLPMRAGGFVGQEVG